MVRASAVGAVDYTACDHTRRWWTGSRMKVRVVEQELHLRTRELMAYRAVGVQGMHDLGQKPDFRQKYAIEAIERFQHEAMPWFALEDEQNELTEDEKLDRIAQWYLVYGGAPRV